MDKERGNQASGILVSLGRFLQKCILGVLSAGPIPQHIAFIMDGNQRYAKKQNLVEGSGHRVGFLALMWILQHCYELGVKYVTIYAFSIDNFKRSPEEVQSVMELMQEKIEGLVEEESIVNRYGVRVHFIGNLELLSRSVRLAADRATAATASNSKAVLSICIAYTSTDEITHAIQESCQEKCDELKVLDASGAGYGLIGLGGIDKNQEEDLISVVDIERHMSTAAIPNPDILIRTSGETRLSNFLLWQTTHCHLYSPPVLWPEIRFWHLFWAILEYQKKSAYLEARKKIVQAPQLTANNVPP